MDAALRRALCGALLAVALPLPAGEAEPDIKVEATGLRLVSSAASQDESVRPFNWSLANWSAGTSVALLLSSSKGGLLQFDAADSVLVKFTDDKGTDLLARPPEASGAAAARSARAAGFSLPKISKDGKCCAVEVSTPHRPAKGAACLRLEGVITLLCATEKTEHVQKGVLLQKGSKIAAPNLELLILEVGKPETGDEPLGVTFRASRDLDEVAEIRFCRADGTEIKSRRMGVSKMGVLGALMVDWSFNLADKVDSATVKLLLWKDLTKTKAPFNLEVGVGSF